ncbi:MAG: hypothetical protein WD824_22080 [Cyclobacteriaceae bacterium]
MVAEYTAAIKKIKEACVLHKVNASWTTVRYDDNTFVYLFPIAGLSALDKGVLADLQTKMGNEAFSNLWPDINKCVDSHNTIIVTRLPELSYLNPVEGDNFVDLLFLTAIPGKEMEMEAVFR